MMTESDPQRTVDQHFDRESDYWRDVYSGNGAESLGYRTRMETVLDWIGRLSLPAGAPALDVGCGAGLMALELVELGMQVTACDSSPAMVRQAQELLDARHPGAAARVVRADAHDLPFPPASARLIVALGLIPWLTEPQRAVDEMARVLEPGGWLILTADNALRLNVLTDPLDNRLAALLRPAARALSRRRRRPDGPPAEEHAPCYRHRASQVREMLAAVGLRPSLETTVGFGPFTFMGREFLNKRLSTALSRRLQALAGRNPRLRRHGWHYIVAAQRPVDGGAAADEAPAHAESA